MCFGAVKLPMWENDMGDAGVEADGILPMGFLCYTMGVDLHCISLLSTSTYRGICAQCLASSLLSSLGSPDFVSLEL